MFSENIIPQMRREKKYRKDTHCTMGGTVNKKIIGIFTTAFLCVSPCFAGKGWEKVSDNKIVRLDRGADKRGSELRGTSQAGFNKLLLLV